MGLGEFAVRKPPFTQGIVNLHTPHDLTVKSVALAVERVVHQPKYTIASKRVQRLAKTYGGIIEAARLVEMAATHGVQHLCAQERCSCHSCIWPSAMIGSLTTVGLVG